MRSSSPSSTRGCTSCRATARSSRSRRSTQARPVWIDDPHFNPGYHVRHTALPAPASLEQLRNVAGRVLAQRLDRTKPLWEIWLVDEVERRSLRDDLQDPPLPRRRRLGRRHRDRAVRPRAGSRRRRSRRRRGSRGPSRARPTLLADALAERVSVPLDAARGRRSARSRTRSRRPGSSARPQRVSARWLRRGLCRARRPARYNVAIGPHRRFAWADGDLAQFKAIKDALGGTVNDVVLTVVTGALRSHMVRHGHDPDGIELKAMVPVSVRADAERGALGNRVTAMYAPLPVYAADPVERFGIVHEAMQGLKESGQAVGAEAAHPARGLRAADRARPRPRGCSPPALLQPRRHQRARPAVPALPAGPPAAAHSTRRSRWRSTPRSGSRSCPTTGTLNFGLLGDYDALPDLDALAAALRDAIAELAAAAGARAPRRRRRRAPARAAEVRRLPRRAAGRRAVGSRR